MTGANDSPGDARELPLLLGGVGSEPEALLLIALPSGDGTVNIREWTSRDWSAIPRHRRERSETLLQWLEAQGAAGRSMNQSLYAVRQWLRGLGDDAR